mgnify:CR=1 FL=1
MTKFNHNTVKSAIARRLSISESQITIFEDNNIQIELDPQYFVNLSDIYQLINVDLDFNFYWVKDIEFNFNMYSVINIYYGRN